MTSQGPQRDTKCVSGAPRQILSVREPPSTLPHLGTPHYVRSLHWMPYLSHWPDRRTTIPPTDWSQSEPAKTQPTGPRAGRAQRSLHWQLLQPLLQDRRSLSRCRRRHTGVADQGAGSLVHGLLPKIHPSAQQGNRYRGSGNSKERLCDQVTKLEPTLNVWGSPYTTPD